MNAQSTSASTTSSYCSTNPRAAPSLQSLQTAACSALPSRSMETSAVLSGTVHVRKTVLNDVDKQLLVFAP